MQWKEIPQDWLWIGDPERINAEIRVHMARRDLRQDKVADIIGLKRQALARRLKGETPWRLTELERLALKWGLALHQLIIDENGTRADNHP